MKKIATILASAILIALPVAADDFDFGDIIADDGDGGAAVSAVSVSGEALVAPRFYAGDLLEEESWDGEDLTDGTWEINPEVRLDLGYSMERTEFAASVNLDEEKVSTDLIDELTVTQYGDKLTFTLGYQKVVWGKGDKLHVVDMLNPMDYIDFLNEDYLDRKMAQPMAHLAMPLGMNGRIELAYVPTFEGDSLAFEGAWVIDDTQQLIDNAEAAVYQSAEDLASSVSTAAFIAGGGSAAAAVSAAQAGSAASLAYLMDHSDVEDLLPSTESLEYGQGGIRLTGTLGAFDLGALYYYGRYRTPSVTFDGEVYEDGDIYEDMTVAYDKLHVFGVEAGGVVAGFNLRGEGAYYMTEDFSGTHKDIHNPSLNYLAGFDRNLPVNNVNFNIQVTGSYRLFHNETNVAGDIEQDDFITDTQIVAVLTDSYNHEKINPELAVVYCIEDMSSLVKPSVEFIVDGNMAFTAGGTLFLGNEDSTMGQFSHNDFVEITASYRF